MAGGRGKQAQTRHVSEDEIIAACRAFARREGPTPDEALAHKYPRKVILARMRRMVDRGVLNYGVSLRTAFVVADRP